MIVNNVGSHAANLLTQAKNASAGNTDDFRNILSDALDQASQADAANQGSTANLLSGDTNSLADAMIDSQKATIQLSLAVAIRDRVIEAYTEVMRMQI